MKNLARTIFTAIAFALATASLADTGAEPRQSLTSEGTDIERGRVGDGKVSYNEHEPLRLSDSSSSGTMSAKPQGDVRQPTMTIGMSADPNFWFYDVHFVLFSDFDRDGYYFGIDLTFEQDIAYETLVRTMDAVRVSETIQDDSVVRSDLFPNISIGDAPVSDEGA